MAHRCLFDKTHCFCDTKLSGIGYRSVFLGKINLWTCYGRGDPIERRMGLKWRVASLLDNGQRFSSLTFGTQSRVDMHTHEHVTAHTCMYSRMYVSSVTRYLVLTHYLTLDRLFALSLKSLSPPSSSRSILTRHRMSHEEVLIRPRSERGFSRAFVRDEFSPT